MSAYNLDTLVKIVVSKITKSNKFVYQEYRKKSLFKKELKEGFIYYDYNWRMLIDDSTYSKEQLENMEYIVEGKNVFKAPMIKLYFSNSDEYQYYEVFKTNSEAKERALFITKDLTNTLIIE